MIESLTALAKGLSGNRVSASSSIENFSPKASGVDPAKGASESFGDILSKISTGLGAHLQKAEDVSFNKLAGGDVPVREVVNSIMEAEQSLNVAIAIRDKVVQAYLEISHMQI